MYPLDLNHICLGTADLWLQVLHYHTLPSARGITLKIPEGYDEVINPRVDKEDCLFLQKAMYGLDQAARQFWMKIVDKMQEGGFKLSEADPCMLYIEDEKRGLYHHNLH